MAALGSMAQVTEQRAQCYQEENILLLAFGNLPTAAKELLVNICGKSADSSCESHEGVCSFIPRNA